MSFRLGKILGTVLGTLLIIAIVGLVPVHAHASKHYMNSIPKTLRGVWYTNGSSMGTFEHGGSAIVHYTRHAKDAKSWNLKALSHVQVDKCQKLSKHALKLVKHTPHRGQFAFEQVGHNLWNEYYITKTHGKTRYVTNYYMAKIRWFGSTAGGPFLYKWQTSTTAHKFSHRPLQGKHAIVSSKTLKHHGTSYNKVAYYDSDSK